MAQNDISNVLEKYARMRDIHGPSVRFFIPSIILANCIAKAANASLLAKHHTGKQIMFQNYPRISAIQIFDTYHKTVQYIWKKYRNHTTAYPIFVQINPLHLQFTYCDEVRKKNENIWKFGVFPDCLDKWTWLAIGCTFIGVSLTQFISTWVSTHDFSIEIGNIILTTLSPLISPGVVTNAYISDLSGTFTLWLFVCVIVSNFYTGILTSLLISPPPPDTMSKVEDVRLRNYSLIFDSPFLLDSLNSTVSSHFMGASKFHQEDISTLKALLENVKIFFEKPEFLKVLAIGSYKVAIVVRWPFAMNAAAKASVLLHQNGIFVKRQCFVGKELVHSGPYYYGLYYLKLRDKFLELLEAGIVDLWSKELLGLAYSPGRVQDRLKVKSPTNFVTGDNEELAALQMQGKIVTIFLIWMLCLVVALISFSLEKLVCRRVGTKP